MHVHSDGLRAAAIFVLRVGASVSLAILLILTTRWADILKSLRVLRVPTVFVIVLSMTYRYIFLLLHTANGMFLARKSRMVAHTSGKEERWWIVSAIGVLMQRLVSHERGRVPGDAGARVPERDPDADGLSPAWPPTG